MIKLSIQQLQQAGVNKKLSLRTEAAKPAKGQSVSENTRQGQILLPGFKSICVGGLIWWDLESNSDAVDVIQLSAGLRRLPTKDGVSPVAQQ